MDCFFFQAEDGIRDLVRSRGLGDVYKRQDVVNWVLKKPSQDDRIAMEQCIDRSLKALPAFLACLLYTSDAADERSSVDLGGRRIIKKKNRVEVQRVRVMSIEYPKLRQIVRVVVRRWTEGAGEYR